ncbi:glycosyltransferase [Pseudooceanicola sp.]|uniref:glycosyltransferase n=1 Tax=Pseudooceanicola sp. TaxID=1914328 RepID=UPI0035172E84
MTAGTLPNLSAQDQQEIRPGPDKERTLHIAILLATRNGAAYLPEQLASYAAQSHADWSLRVGDDGSTDATRDQVAAFGRAHPDHRVALEEGPRAGAAANFLCLVERAAAETPGACLAFSDQDDVWLPEKSARAIDRLGQAGALEPGGPVAVHVCRTRLTDARLNPAGLSRLPPRGYDFGNALVQNVLGGNTIVLSPAAAALVARTVPAAREAGVAHHDWWVYLVVTGAGGLVLSDPEPGVLYRQHGDNLMGNHGGIRTRLKRLEQVSRGLHARWIDSNLAALDRVDTLLAPAARHLAARFRDARRRGPRALVEVLREGQIRRQTPNGDRLLHWQARTARL